MSLVLEEALLIFTLGSLFGFGVTKLFQKQRLKGARIKRIRAKRSWDTTPQKERKASRIIRRFNLHGISSGLRAFGRYARRT